MAALIASLPRCMPLSPHPPLPNSQRLRNPFALALHSLVLASELLAGQPLQHLPDGFGGLGEHGEHGHARGQPACLLEPEWGADGIGAV